MSIPYHDESLLWTERHRQAVIDRRPCPKCGGDVLRQDFTGSGKCHTPSPITPPPYLAAPDPTPTRPAPITVLIRTRYGLEHHKHVDGDTHRAGPTCPCGPEIEWGNR